VVAETLKKRRKRNVQERNVGNSVVKSDVAYNNCWVDLNTVN